MKDIWKTKESSSHGRHKLCATVRRLGWKFYAIAVKNFVCGFSGKFLWIFHDFLKHFFVSFGNFPLVMLIKSTKKKVEHPCSNLNQNRRKKFHLPFSFQFQCQCLSIDVLFFQEWAYKWKHRSFCGLECQVTHPFLPSYELVFLQHSHTFLIDSRFLCRP